MTSHSDTALVTALIMLRLITDIPLKLGKVFLFFPQPPELPVLSPEQHLPSCDFRVTIYTFTDLI